MTAGKFYKVPGFYAADLKDAKALLEELKN